MEKYNYAVAVITAVKTKTDGRMYRIVPDVVWNYSGENMERKEQES